MICPKPVGNRLTVTIHLVNKHWHGKVSFSSLQILRHCRPGTGRILCNVCLLGVVIVLLHRYVYSSFFFFFFFVSLKFKSLGLSQNRDSNSLHAHGKFSIQQWMMFLYKEKEKARHFKQIF